MTLEPGLRLEVERAMDLGAELLRRGRWHVGSVMPKGDRDYATRVDLEIEQTIREALGQATPGVPFLGEEGGGGSPSESPALWILDPIDGTVNFANGSPLCAISLALVEKGEPVLGIIDLPLLGERYVASRGAGAHLNGDKIHVVEKQGLSEAMVGFADFAVGAAAEPENTIHRELMSRLVERCLRVRVHGSESVDLAWLAAGRLDVTVMISSLPWDVTAGVLIAREAGAQAFDSDGAPWIVDSTFTIGSTPGMAAELIPIVQEAVSAAAASPSSGS